MNISRIFKKDQIYWNKEKNVFINWMNPYIECVLLLIHEIINGTDKA